MLKGRGDAGLPAGWLWEGAGTLREAAGCAGAPTVGAPFPMHAVVGLTIVVFGVFFVSLWYFPPLCVCDYCIFFQTPPVPSFSTDFWEMWISYMHTQGAWGSGRRCLLLWVFQWRHSSVRQTGQQNRVENSKRKKKRGKTNRIKKNKSLLR